MSYEKHPENHRSIDQLNVADTLKTYAQRAAIGAMLMVAPGCSTDGNQVEQNAAEAMTANNGKVDCMTKNPKFANAKGRKLAAKELGISLGEFMERYETDIKQSEDTCTLLYWEKGTQKPEMTPVIKREANARSQQSKETQEEIDDLDRYRVKFTIKNPKFAAAKGRKLAAEQLGISASLFNKRYRTEVKEKGGLVEFRFWGRGKDRPDFDKKNKEAAEFKEYKAYINGLLDDKAPLKTRAQKARHKLILADSEKWQYPERWNERLVYETQQTLARVITKQLKGRFDARFTEERKKGELAVTIHLKPKGRVKKGGAKKFTGISINNTAGVAIIDALQQIGASEDFVENVKKTHELLRHRHRWNIDKRLLGDGRFESSLAGVMAYNEFDNDTTVSIIVESALPSDNVRILLNGKEHDLDAQATEPMPDEWTPEVKERFQAFLEAKDEWIIDDSAKNLSHAGYKEMLSRKLAEQNFPLDSKVIIRRVFRTASYRIDVLVNGQKWQGQVGTFNGNDGRAFVEALGLIDGESLDENQLKEFKSMVQYDSLHWEFENSN